MSLENIEIARRFCGPPRSGNGGYVAGRLAKWVQTDEEMTAIAVRLFSPPPLETPLAVRASDGRFGLFADETRVAEARAVALDLSPPDAPSCEAARRAAESFRGFPDLVFPKCFVCGYQREDGDGLRIFPCESTRPGVFAAPWIPDAVPRS